MECKVSEEVDEEALRLESENTNLREEAERLRAELQDMQSRLNTAYTRVLMIDSDTRVLKRQVSILLEWQAKRDKHRPELCGSLEWMPEGVMSHIIRHLDSRAIRAFRSVCKGWLKYAYRNVEVLRPCKPITHKIIAQLPHLTYIDMSACRDVRNRNLSILEGNLKIKSLFIGKACMFGKPRITNEALDSIALMRGLHALSLCDCNAITDKGMMALSTLTGLTSLAINSCPCISDKGFAVVEHLRLLQSISVFGCVKVKDRLLRFLSCLKGLSYLQLGYTKISEKGIAQLRNFPALADLRFFAEKAITDNSLANLGDMTNLRGLSLACCGNHITGAGLLRLLESLPRLQFLDLQNCIHVGDDCVVELPKVAKHNDFLQLQGTGLGVRGLCSLTGLTSLRRLFLDSSHLPSTPFTPHTLLCVSELTQLVQLEVRTDHFPPELLQAMGKLRKLERLGLSVCYATHGPTAEGGGSSSSIGRIQKGSTTGFMSLTCCTSLTCLMFSRMDFRPEEVAHLIQQLPLLSQVQLTDCRGEEELAKKQFPLISLHIHTCQLQHPRDYPSNAASLYTGSNEYMGYPTQQADRILCI